jgi:hypothetical protein
LFNTYNLAKQCRVALLARDGDDISRSTHGTNLMEGASFRYLRQGITGSTHGDMQSWTSSLPDIVNCRQSVASEENFKMKAVTPHTNVAASVGDYCLICIRPEALQA